MKKIKLVCAVLHTVNHICFWWCMWFLNLWSHSKCHWKDVDQIQKQLEFESVALQCHGGDCDEFLKTDQIMWLWNSQQLRLVGCAPSPWQLKLLFSFNQQLRKASLKHLEQLSSVLRLNCHFQLTKSVLESVDFLHFVSWDEKNTSHQLRLIECEPSDIGPHCWLQFDLSVEMRKTPHISWDWLNVNLLTLHCGSWNNWLLSADSWERFRSHIWNSWAQFQDWIVTSNWQNQSCNQLRFFKFFSWEDGFWKLKPVHFADVVSQSHPKQIDNSIIWF